MKTVLDKDHGMDWGWYRRVGQGWSVKTVGKGGDFERITSVKNIEPNQFVVKFGNDFGPGWIDHKTIPHSHWRFWDNPEIPHFLYPNPVNPLAHKSWIRWTPSDILTTHKHERGSDRINQIIREITKRNLTWHDIVVPKTVTRPNSKTVVLLPSSANCYKYYYRTEQSIWINTWRTRLEKLGYTVIVHQKTSRKLRTMGPQYQLAAFLDGQNALCTVSQHSAAALETILTGIPAVVTGPHPSGELATPMEEFLLGHLRTPNTAEVEDWCDWVLGNIRHKHEIWSGAWHD